MCSPAPSFVSSTGIPATFGRKRDDKAHEKTLDRLRELQHLLYADKRYSLLIVLQGLDAAGKDGTIRHVMSGVNPQGCDVTSFKAPSSEELARDYLWRIHKAVPPRGSIGIFNRSHYEAVLIVRVHELVPKSIGVIATVRLTTWGAC